MSKTCGYCGRPVYTVGEVIYDPGHVIHDCADELLSERDKLRAEVEVQRNDKELFEKRWCDEVDAHEKTKLQLGEALHHLRMALPLAKGYAGAHRVGINQQITGEAETFLEWAEASDSRKGDPEPGLASRVKQSENSQ